MTEGWKLADVAITAGYKIYPFRPTPKKLFSSVKATTKGSTKPWLCLITSVNSLRYLLPIWKGSDRYEGFVLASVI